MKNFWFMLTRLACFFMCITVVSGCSTFKINHAAQSCRINIEYASNMDMGTKNDMGTKTIWVDKKLQDTFCKYWTSRYDGNMKETYAMEAPEFRKRVTNAQYENYVKRTSDNVLNKITINGTGKDENNLMIVDCLFSFKLNKSGKDDSSFIRDKWIKIDDGWFHAMSDPIFFPIKYE